MTGVGFDDPVERTICHDLAAGIGNLSLLTDSQPQTLAKRRRKLVRDRTGWRIPQSFFCATTMPSIDPEFVAEYV